MLWRKESTQPGALYVDIFAEKGKGRLERCYGDALKSGRSPPSKNDPIAETKRKMGDHFFAKHKWSDAMNMYNDSLYFSENGSIGLNNMSLAYANRSACFFRSKLYKECLVDIELAKEAGYPVHLLPKLEKRKEECLRYIAEGAMVDDFGLKLSYEPDDQFPCMANVLKLDRSADGENAVYAKEDIAVGQTIVVEKAFSTYLHQQYGWKCHICLKGNANLVPCKKCTLAMFCNDGCNGNFLHEFECGLKFTRDTQMNGIIMHEVRVVLMAIRMFSTVDELMEFVEQTTSSDRNELPENFADEKSRYRTFLKLPVNSKSSDLEHFIFTTFCAYRTLLDIPKIKSMFPTEKHRRFLMHLITLHALISQENSIRTRSTLETSLTERNDMCFHTTIIKHFFKHSCAPNVLFLDRDGNSVFITIRPIKKGEQLLTNVLNILKEPTQKRQETLWEFKNFVCKCSRCEGAVPTPQQLGALASDPNFRSILSTRIAQISGDKMHALMDKCVAFLNRHGQIAWCTQLGRVIEIYIYLLRRRLNGTISHITLLDMILKQSLTDS